MIMQHCMIQPVNLNKPVDHIVWRKKNLYTRRKQVLIFLFFFLKNLITPFQNITWNNIRFVFEIFINLENSLLNFFLLLIINRESSFVLESLSYFRVGRDVSSEIMQN